MPIINISRTIFATVLLMMSCLSPLAIADIPVGQYSDFKKTEPGFTDYLIGIGRGVFWANVMLKVRDQQPLFCMPSKLSLDEGIILSLIDQEIRSPSSGRRWKEDTPIEFVMVIAFQKRFLCN